MTLPDTSLQLLPELAAFDPASATLYVADLHLGKSAAFRAAGLALPDGPDAETLGGLSTLITRLRARRLIILGDVFHDRILRRDQLHREVTAWRASHPGVTVTIIPGNHDRRIQWDEWLPGAEILTPGSSVSTFTLFHHPPEPSTASGLMLCGHLHPGLSLGRRLSRVTTPCFRLQQNVLTLPAFGSFTGLQIMDPVAGDRFFVSLRQTVVEVPGRV